MILNSDRPLLELQLTAGGVITPTTGFINKITPNGLVDISGWSGLMIHQILTGTLGSEGGYWDLAVNWHVPSDRPGSPMISVARQGLGIYKPVWSVEQRSLYVRARTDAVSFDSTLAGSPAGGAGTMLVIPTNREYTHDLYTPGMQGQALSWGTTNTTETTITFDSYVGPAVFTMDVRQASVFTDTIIRSYPAGGGVNLLAAVKASTTAGLEVHDPGCVNLWIPPGHTTIEVNSTVPGAPAYWALTAVG